MTAEDSLNIACANYMRLQYPKVLFTHVPNGGSRNAIEAAKLKKMGVSKGCPDLLIFHRTSGCAGLAIELKVKYTKVLKSGTIKETPNMPTPEQMQWLEDLYNQNWSTHVIYSLDEFRVVVDGYMLGCSGIVYAEA